jgi:hypothetical protein
MQNLSYWLSANKLTLNPQKSNYILFNNHLNLTCFSGITINSTPVLRVAETSILGVLVDQNLTYKSHLIKLKNKLASSLFIFRRIRYKIPLSQRGYCTTHFSNRTYNIVLLYGVILVLIWLH